MLDRRRLFPGWGGGGGGSRGLGDEALFLLVAAALGQDFPTAENVQHGILADRAGFPGGYEGGDLGGGQAGGA